MFNSRESLLKAARAQGYKPEILEKVYRLLDIFQQMISVPYLKDRLVLKGGTALNLFCFDHLPRLSVDIDLNYIGQLDKAKMLEEKPILIDAINQILMQNQFERERSPMRHAGSKMIWLYNSLLGQRGSIEIDINFMYRQPFLPIVHSSPKLFTQQNWEAPFLDIHELAAGKLAALFGRKVSRDLFDAHYLMTKAQLNIEKLRLVFVIYVSMTKINLSNLFPESVQLDLIDLKNRLMPVMQQKGLPRSPQQIRAWTATLLTELHDGLKVLLPLKENEIKFIEAMRQEGKIYPTLITKEHELAQKIETNPAIHWRIQQNRTHVEQ